MLSGVTFLRPQIFKHFVASFERTGALGQFFMDFSTARDGLAYFLDIFPQARCSKLIFHTFSHTLGALGICIALAWAK